MGSSRGFIRTKENRGGKEIDMANWKMKADASEESVGGGGNFEPAPRGIYTIQVANYKDKKTTTGRDMVVLECEIADQGPEFGKKVWHNVVAIPKGEKGHGIMVHSLHAFGLAHDGNLDFDTSEFQGRTARVLLGVEPYTKVKDGKTYTNDVNRVEALYTDNNPEPKEVPAARVVKAAEAKNGTSKVEAELGEVPF